MKQIKFLKTFLWLTFLVTIVTTSSCSDNDEDTSNLKGTLTGVVTDEGMVSIGDVQISLSTMDRTSFTKDNGQYTLSNIPLSEQTVTYTKTGYITVTETIDPVDFDTRNVISLNITMIQDVYVLTGRITDSETGMPVKEVTVTYEAGTTTSDSEGFYLLEEIEKGSYTFEFSKEDYQTVTKILNMNDPEKRATTLDMELSRDN